MPRAERAKSSYDLLINEVSLQEAAVATRVPRLDVIPATEDLSGAEIELVEYDARTHRLDRVLTAHDGALDVILIDCPPSLGLLTLNAMVAAYSLLVPLQDRTGVVYGQSLSVRFYPGCRRFLK